MILVAENLTRVGSAILNNDLAIEKPDGAHAPPGCLLITDGAMLFVARTFLDSFHHVVEVEAAGLLPRREIAEAL